MSTNSLEYERKYRFRNKEKLKKRKHAWYMKNRARILALQSEYNRTVRTPRNAARRMSKIISEPVSDLLPPSQYRPRNSAPQPGENSVSNSEYDSDLPAAPRADTPPGDGLETDSMAPVETNPGPGPNSKGTGS